MSTSVNSVTSTLAAGSLGTAGGKSTSGLMGKEDFLKLLVAQLKNQDPLNPQDPTEFTGQLAQFSQLEQALATNTHLEALAGMTGDMQQMSALGTIGKDALLEADYLTKSSEEPITLGYRLDAPAAACKVHVLDPSGKSVRSFDVSALGSGEHFLTWDGKDNSGGTVPAGTYFLSVVAQDSQEKRVSSQPLIRGHVTGVDLSADGNRLVTDVGSFDYDKLLQVLGG